MAPHNEFIMFVDLRCFGAKSILLQRPKYFETFKNWSAWEEIWSNRNNKVWNGWSVTNITFQCGKNKDKDRKKQILQRENLDLLNQKHEEFIWNFSIIFLILAVGGNPTFVFWVWFRW